MSKKIYRILSLLLCCCFIFEQTGFAQISVELNIAGHLSALHNPFAIDRFRPMHLRYLQYLPADNNFKLYLDKGDSANTTNPTNATNAAKDLLKYFFIGLALPNNSFWVNLRPNSPDNIIDEYLSKTDVGKIMLETDLQLKRDTAAMTSPATPEGRTYWDKLYKKAAELFGSDNVDIPTLTRPWIVPGEIIIRETTGSGYPASAYIYKATLKVCLEEDYLTVSGSQLAVNQAYSFKDPRLKALNEYSTQLIKELVIPKLTKEVNSSKRYASLRQVYYSLILAQWFKTRHKGLSPSLDSARDPLRSQGTVPKIDSKDLTNLISKDPWSKTTYFQAYQKSFKDGEYNIQEPVYAPTGQTIKSYFSGGENFEGITGSQMTIIPASQAASAVLKNLIAAPSVSSPLEDNPAASPSATKPLAEEPAKATVAGSPAQEEKIEIYPITKLTHIPKDRNTSSPATARPGFSPKVIGETVGIVRVIPDIVTNYRKLWEIKDNEIAAVNFYPTADPTFSRPMGIITSEEAPGLSHAEVRARYWRIPHAVIKNLNDLKHFDGKWVYIKVTDAGVELRPATADEIKNYESYKPKTPAPQLEEVDLTTKANILEWTHAENPKEVSHKFAGLHTAAKAQSYGSSFERHGHPLFYIHWGSVIPYATYKRVFDANPGVEEHIRTIVQSINNEDIDDIKTKLAQVRELIVNMEIPESIWGNAEKETGDYGTRSIDYTVRNETYDGKGVFVRAGTNAEDLPDYPGFGAGQYGTFSNVMRKDVKTAVKMAWASAWNEGAYIDRMKVGVDHFSVYPAVQITKAIDAKYAFVVHTADPNGEDQDKLIIEIAQGLGEGLVGDKYPGEAHRYVYSKSQDKIVKFDAATKREKAVLNPEGGIKRTSSDYADDLFVHEGETSTLALDIARQAVAIEKAAGRPQDIEGAIEYNDYSKDYRWMVLQSRSEVGYDRAPTPWEEYFKANREWALAFMAKHKDVFTARVTSYSFESDVQEMLKKEIASNQDERIVGDNIANKLRLFCSLGEEGKNFAGKVLICGVGVHRELQGALGRLPLSMRADIIARAAIDYEMLDKDALDDFEHTSNYNIARIIVVYKTEALRKIFNRIPPRNLVFLLAEVIAFYHKPKADWEAADIKDFSWDAFSRIVKDIYEQYPPDKKKEFSAHLSIEAAMNLGIRKEQSDYRLTPGDRDKLFGWRYYHKPQAIILSATSIDGCLGLDQFFVSLRLSLGQGENKTPFHFFILMDIPNERPEDFLRRNGLVGNDITAILMPSEVNARNIIWNVNNPINNNLSESVLLNGDSIVIVGQEETISRYRTTEDSVLTLSVLPQRGQIPLVIAEAINLLTRAHEDNEAKLSAWLTSRGLDGTKRYH